MFAKTSNLSKRIALLFLVLSRIACIAAVGSNLPTLRFFGRTNLWRQEIGPPLAIQSLSVVANRVDARFGESLTLLRGRGSEGNVLLAGAGRGGLLRESGLVIPFSIDHFPDLPRMVSDSGRWEGRLERPGWGRYVAVCPDNRFGDLIVIGNPSIASRVADFECWRREAEDDEWRMLPMPAVGDSRRRLLTQMTLPGDLDGDGWADLVVADVINGTRGERIVLRLHKGVFDGFKPDPEGVIQIGETGGLKDLKSDDFVLQVCSDVDGDGLPDLLVGLPREASGDNVTGEVRLVGMDGSEFKVKPLRLLLGDAKGFGKSISSSDDLDGDGIPELIVGAYGDNQAPGLIAVYRGRSRGWEPIPYAILKGNQARDGTGMSFKVVRTAHWSGLAVGVGRSRVSEGRLENGEGEIFIIPQQEIKTGMVRDMARLSFRAGRIKCSVARNLVDLGDLRKNGGTELAFGLPMVSFAANRGGRVEILSLPAKLPVERVGYFLSHDEDPGNLIQRMEAGYSARFASNNTAWKLATTKATVAMIDSHALERRFIWNGVLAIVGASSLGVWLWRRRVEWVARNLERVRIARDLHDHLGAQMSQIHLLSCLTKSSEIDRRKLEENLERIASAAEAVSTDVSKLSWMLNPENDLLEEFINYLSDFTSKFLESPGIEVAFDFPDEIPRARLSMEMRSHLFSVFKEALTNIVRHAEASRVCVRANVIKNRLQLIVEDDGRGLSESKGRFNPGNGLKNMAGRMAELGGHFEIRNGSDRGTVVKIDSPLPRWRWPKPRF